MKFAQRMSRLGTESAFEVLARARALEAQGRDVVHLEIGEPDFDTPHHIVDAAVQALHDGYTHYTPSAGMPVLREAVADYISHTRRVHVTPEQVVITPGGKPIMFYVLLALCEEGDEVILPNPSFPIYESMINFSGAKPVPVPLTIEKGFSFGAEDLRPLINEHTRLLILNSPANPTGGVQSAEELQAIARLAEEHNLRVMSDEIYSRIVYDEKFHSIASIPGMLDNTIILDGFSKTYAMTGWRLGYGVMPVELAQSVTRLMTNSNSCTAAFTQVAGAAALTGSQECVEEMVSAFKQRRDVIVNGLNHIPGFKCLMPKGAFYAFPSIKDTGRKSKELADYLLTEAGVAALAGNAFGAYGEGHMRFSYATSIDNIERALDRIDAAVRKL